MPGLLFLERCFRVTIRIADKSDASHQMKVLHINSSGIHGGAGRAAYRIHDGLRNAGIDSGYFTQDMVKNSPAIISPQDYVDNKMAIIRPYLERNAFKIFFGGAKVVFSPAWLSLSSTQEIVTRQSPDIVNLHWVCNSVLRPEDLTKFSRPILWTLHDMWPFTGGCHYSDGCLNYQQHCGDCHVLFQSSSNDISQSIHRRKQKAWDSLQLTIVSPSRWLAACASQSSLFSGRRIEVIPTGIDLETFRPGEKLSIRKDLKLPADKKLILFGAINATGDRRKGFDLLHGAIQSLSRNTREQMEILVFGSNEPRNPPDFGLPVHYLGRIIDDPRLVSIYSAADVMVVPSREDNLPNTAVESIACGTPVVAFDIGGMSDIIDHLKNGYLAPAFEADRLAQGIEWVLADNDRYQVISKEARRKAEDSFDITTTVNQYRSVYQSLL